MNLLIITRKIDKNDPRVGFAYGWVKKLAEEEMKYLDSRVFVLCLEKGDIEGLPQNVSINSLGKESGVNRIGRFIEFQKLAWKLVPQVNGIFCHMNPEYTINIWPYAKIFRKKIVSWHTHGTVTWKLRILEKMADVILTASARSFRIPSKKVVVTGHGIDTELFCPDASKNPGEIFTLLTVGRISPTKDIESLIKAVDILVKNNVRGIRVDIVGSPGLDEHLHYSESLKMMVRAMGLEEIIHFRGPIPNRETVVYYQRSDLFVNLSGTGSVDKAVLEAMACGCLVLTSNDAFSEFLPPEFLVEKNQPEKLAERILQLMKLSPENAKSLKENLRQIVLKSHNLENLVKKILEQFL